MRSWRPLRPAARSPPHALDTLKDYRDLNRRRDARHAPIARKPDAKQASL